MKLKIRAKAGGKPRPFTISDLKPQKTEEQIQNGVCSFLRRFHRNVFYHVDLAGIRVNSPYQRKIIHDQQGPAGFPDIVIYERRGGFNGLVLEMKRESPYRKRDGQLKDDPHLRDQERWLQQFRESGYVTGFFWAPESAIKAINEYLQLPFDCEG